MWGEEVSMGSQGSLLTSHHSNSARVSTKPGVMKGGISPYLGRLSASQASAILWSHRPRLAGRPGRRCFT